jgi:hypothetical protein
MARQFVGVKFKPGAQNEYTYHHDHEGDPLAVGDLVVIDSRNGTVTLAVTSVRDVAPPFATKPITGRAPNAAQ